jgi:hypothetical protein
MMTMNAVAEDTGWQAYALTGRPDLLNYMRRGDVTWSELWRFYRQSPADPSAMIRVMGLFHMFLSHDYDGEGCVLDADGRVYPQLREWARFVVDSQDFVPEEKLRDSLAGLLGQSLISPLYYEAVFNAYLEAALHKHAAVWSTDSTLLEKLRTPEMREPREGRLAIHLHDMRWSSDLQDSRYWHDTVSMLMGRHYAAWDQAYALALGEDDETWLDDGGEG